MFAIKPISTVLALAILASGCSQIAWQPLGATAQPQPKATPPKEDYKTESYIVVGGVVVVGLAALVVYSLLDTGKKESAAAEQLKAGEAALASGDRGPLAKACMGPELGIHYQASCKRLCEVWQALPKTDDAALNEYAAIPDDKRDRVAACHADLTNRHLQWLLDSAVAASDFKKLADRGP